MTRESRREIKRTVEDLEPDADDDPALPPPIRSVYRDPVTHRLYEGRGDDAAPVESLPADARLLISPRTLCMSRKRAEREHREILEVINESPEVVSVRTPPADDIPTEDAVIFDQPADVTIEFTEVDT